MSIQPYIGAVTAVDVPAAGDSKSGGLIVVGGPSYTMDRGVVVDVGPEVEHLSPGDIIYWNRGDHAEIGDVKIVPAQRIAAFESA